MAINLKGNAASSFSNSLNVRDINAVNTGENSIFLGYDGETLKTQIWANGTVITTGTIQGGDSVAGSNFGVLAYSNSEASGSKAALYARNYNSSGDVILCESDTANVIAFRCTSTGNGTFAGSVSASNITAFKAALTSAVTGASDVATLKSAILSAIASL